MTFSAKFFQNYEILLNLLILLNFQILLLIKIFLKILLKSRILLDLATLRVGVCEGEGWGGKNFPEKEKEKLPFFGSPFSLKFVYY